MKYFISAPFGNYITYPHAISVTGSWTLKRRSGLFLQILKTLRYTKQGWRNKIGLRNKGLAFALSNVTDDNSVMSIAPIDRSDLINMISLIPPKQSVEINISCPNVDKALLELPEGLSLWGKNYWRKWCIVKIPPISTESFIDQIVDQGFTQIHASNTFPTDRGGLSGKILTPYTLKIVEYIKSKYSHVECIAGGGVTSVSDVNRYVNAGADHISLGTVCFTPWKINTIIKGDFTHE